jgi:hypothetical protein
MFNKKKIIIKKINKYLLTIHLILAGKNNLPTLSFDIKQHIISYIFPKIQTYVNYKHKINNIHYDKEDVTSSIKYYLDKNYYLKNEEKFLNIIDLINYLINNSKFILDNKKFYDTVKKRLLYIRVELKSKYGIKKKINYDLYNKLNEALSKIFLINTNLCIKDRCCIYQSKLSINYGLCHVHLNQKF